MDRSQIYTGVDAREECWEYVEFTTWMIRWLQTAGCVKIHEFLPPPQVISSEFQGPQRLDLFKNLLDRMLKDGIVRRLPGVEFSFELDPKGADGGWCLGKWKGRADYIAWPSQVQNLYSCDGHILKLMGKLETYLDKRMKNDQEASTAAHQLSSLGQNTLQDERSPRIEYCSSPRLSAKRPRENVTSVAFEVPPSSTRVTGDNLAGSKHIDHSNAESRSKKPRLDGSKLRINIGKVSSIAISASDSLATPANHPVDSPSPSNPINAEINQPELSLSNQSIDPSEGSNPVSTAPPLNLPSDLASTRASVKLKILHLTFPSAKLSLTNENGTFTVQCGHCPGVQLPLGQGNEAISIVQRHLNGENHQRQVGMSKGKGISNVLSPCPSQATPFETAKSDSVAVSSSSPNLTTNVSAPELAQGPDPIVLPLNEARVLMNEAPTITALQYLRLDTDVSKLSENHQYLEAKLFEIKTITEQNRGQVIEDITAIQKDQVLAKASILSIQTSTTEALSRIIQSTSQAQADYETKIDATLQSMKQLTPKISETCDKRNMILEAHSSLLNSLSDRSIDIEADLSTTKSDLTSLKGEMDDVRDRSHDMDGKLTDLEQQQCEATQRLENLVKTIEKENLASEKKRKGQKAETKTAIDELRGILRGTSEQVSTLTAKTEAETAEAKKSYAKLQREKEISDARILALEAEVMKVNKTFQREKETSNADLRVLRDELAVVKNALRLNREHSRALALDFEDEMKTLNRENQERMDGLRLSHFREMKEMESKNKAVLDALIGRVERLEGELGNVVVGTIARDTIVVDHPGAGAGLKLVAKRGGGGRGRGSGGRGGSGAGA